ncbi:MAG: hypothetical protein ACLSVX_15165 [Massilimicrobiota timonensis]
MFCCDSVPYFFEVLKLKYPEYCHIFNKGSVSRDTRKLMKDIKVKETKRKINVLNKQDSLD